MEAVVGGAACGYAMGVLSTLALTFLVLRIPRDGFLSKIVDEEVPGILLAIPLFTGATLSWGAVGLSTGLIYYGADLDQHPNFLGSPSAPFTLVMLAIAWMPAPPLVIFFRRYWWLWVGMSLSFALLFGWALPFLAGR